MTDRERDAVVAALPSELELGPPEGDIHRLAIEAAKDPLAGHFERLKRNIYISSDLAVYYPGERIFAPDLIAVLDVDPHPREKWIVDQEKRGLDFVLEVHVGGDRTKDFRQNVERFARLGIKEYFVFDPVRLLVRSYALSEEGRTYEPVLGQHGRFPSRVLGLELGLEDGKLRLLYNGARVPETRDLLGRAEKLLSDVMTRHEDAVRRAEDVEATLVAERAEREAERAEREAERAARDATEAELRAEIERLKRR